MHRAIVRQFVLYLSLATCLISTSVTTPALAQQQKSDRAEFPGRRVGGGTRGECLANRQPIVALNPVNNLGVTSKSRPSLYFAVPSMDAAYPVEFVLRDASNQTVYETALEVRKAKQLLGIQLPENSLQVGQDYHWYLSIVCDPDDASQNIVLSGWLRRVPQQVTLGATADIVADLKLAKSYQTAGLWSDAIATLVQLLQTYPTNDQVRLQWQQLLQQLDLEMIVESAIVGQL